MWKKMIEPNVIWAALVTLALSWIASWTLVFKTGCRYENLDATGSFMAYLVTFGTLIPVVLLLASMAAIALANSRHPANSF